MALSISPTNAPILRYDSKDGKSYTAKEVNIINNGKSALGVAVTEKSNPGSALLMTEDTFVKELDKNLDDDNFVYESESYTTSDDSEPIQRLSFYA